MQVKAAAMNHLDLWVRRGLPMETTMPHIGGSLSASISESTWVLTSYLVANAVILPASNWFAHRFGRKRFLLICIVIFTIASFFCGAAPSPVKTGAKWPSP